MSSAKYLKMDKSIVTKGMVFEFEIFTPTNSNTSVKLFKDKYDIVTDHDLDRLSGINALYINSTDRTLYKLAVDDLAKKQTAVDNEPAITKPDTAEEERIKKEKTFEEKSITLYRSATRIINNLFNNPETLGHYEESKYIVTDLVEHILDDQFTIKSLMSIATHDYYTHTHSLNVAIYALSLGSFLQMTKSTLSELGEAALLHDLGKSKVSPEIINKNGKLTDKEFKTMMSHPLLGYSIGLKIGIDNNRVLAGIKHHHEKMDGTGYPAGFSGLAIPLFARIIGICDIFDALTSKRSYKEAMTSFEALKLMKFQMKDHIDHDLLNNMVRMFR